MDQVRFELKCTPRYLTVCSRDNASPLTRECGIWEEVFLGLGAFLLIPGASCTCCKFCTMGRAVKSPNNYDNCGLTVKRFRLKQVGDALFNSDYCVKSSICALFEGLSSFFYKK